LFSARQRGYCHQQPGSPLAVTLSGVNGNLLPWNGESTMKTRSHALAALLAAVLLVTLDAQAQTPLVPDVIFHSGKIAAVTDRFDIVEAIAVREGKIVAVGSNDEVRRLAGSATRLVDFGGRTVLPGFYNAHVHVGASSEANVSL